MLSLTTPTEVARELAATVRAHRLARGWTQAELAQRAGVAAPTYVLFERTGRISLVRFIRVLAVLGIDIERLVATPEAAVRSIDELTAPKRKRGRRRASS